MSNVNTIAINNIASAPVAGWITKAGKAKSAYTETAALASPAIVRKARAAQTDIDKLANGQFRPFLRQCAELCSVKETATIRQQVSLSASAMQALANGGNPLALIDASLATPDKNVAVSFARAIVGMWGNAKGQKAAHASVARQWLVSMDAPANVDALTLQADIVDAESAYLDSGFADDSAAYAIDNVAAMA